MKPADNMNGSPSPYTEVYTQGTSTFANVNHPLTPAYGYGNVLGLGLTFALGMIFVTWLLKRYHNETQTVEQCRFPSNAKSLSFGEVLNADKNGLIVTTAGYERHLIGHLIERY